MKKHKLIWRIAELESNLKTQSNTIKNQQKAMDKLKAILKKKEAQIAGANLMIDLMDDTIRAYEKKHD